MTTRIRGSGVSADNSQLEAVTAKLGAVQRNYETMSRMMTAKAKEFEQVQYCLPMHSLHKCMML